MQVQQQQRFTKIVASHEITAGSATGLEWQATPFPERMPHARAEYVTHRSIPAPLPPPSFKARAFMPEDKPDATLQAWSNRMQAKAGVQS